MAAHPLAARLQRFVNDKDIWHEILVIALSYVFIFAGAWNDGLLGFEPSNGSRF